MVATAHEAPVSAASAPRRLLLGLIGAGIQRSLSPALHEEEGRQQALKLHYQLIDLERSAEAQRRCPA